MKKLIFFSIALMFTLSSCKKQESQLNDTNATNIIKNGVTTHVNPYDDSNRVWIKSIMIDLGDYLEINHSDDNPIEFEVFLDAFDLIVIEHGKPNHEILADTSTVYAEWQTEQFKKIVEFGLSINTITSIEAEVINDVSVPSEAKQRVLYILSIIKITKQEFSTHVASKKPNWAVIEAKFDKCMEQRLGDFNTGDWIVFTLTLPASYGTLAAGCFWEAFS
jgi:hypothetical protein